MTTNNVPAQMAAAAMRETAASNAANCEISSAINTTPPASSTAATTKEKKGWFHSLTRRKKSQSQASLATTITTTSTTIEEQQEAYAAEQQQQQNNNNVATTATMNNAAAAAATTGACRKRKDDKNMFQRLKKKMGLHLSSLRRLRHDDDASGAAGALGNNGTTDASGEFFTRSPAREREANLKIAAADADYDMVPFTHDYHRFISKKWLGNEETGPNRVMYTACSEMINQVWYWGEISRRDAQKQLTDKPTGSFLVRDSETSGCQFTLSFRIVNVTLHYRLEYRDNYWHFEELQYESIVEMIEDILYRCTNDNFVCFVKVPNEMQPPFPVILKYPLSRYLKLPHLQDLCRRVLQRHATPAEIAKWPIPPKLHEYLSEQRELVFQS